MNRLLLFLLLVSPAFGQSFTQVPFVFTNGGIYSPTQLQSDFSSLVAQGNAVGVVLANQIAQKVPVQSGSALFFYNSSCPAGWTQYGASGYYLRGLDLGAGRDPANPTLASTYGPTTQTHTHNYTNLLVGVNTDTIQTLTSVFFAPNYVSASTLSSTTSPSAGGSTMQPKTVQLLFCRKN